MLIPFQPIVTRLFKQSWKFLKRLKTRKQEVYKSIVTSPRESDELTSENIKEELKDDEYDKEKKNFLSYELTYPASKMSCIIKRLKKGGEDALKDEKGKRNVEELLTKMASFSLVNYGLKFGQKSNKFSNKVFSAMSVFREKKKEKSIESVLFLLGNKKKSLNSFNKVLNQFIKKPSLFKKNFYEIETIQKANQKANDVIMKFAGLNPNDGTRSPLSHKRSLKKDVVDSILSKKSSNILDLFNIPMSFLSNKVSLANFGDLEEVATERKENESIPKPRESPNLSKPNVIFY